MGLAVRIVDPSLPVIKTDFLSWQGFPRPFATPPCETQRQWRRAVNEVADWPAATGLRNQLPAGIRAGCPSLVQPPSAKCRRPRLAVFAELGVLIRTPPSHGLLTSQLASWDRTTCSISVSIHSSTSLSIVHHHQQPVRAFVWPFLCVLTDEITSTAAVRRSSNLHRSLWGMAERGSQVPEAEWIKSVPLHTPLV